MYQAYDRRAGWHAWDVGGRGRRSGDGRRANQAACGGKVRRREESIITWRNGRSWLFNSSSNFISRVHPGPANAPHKPPKGRCVDEQLSARSISNSSSSEE